MYEWSNGGGKTSKNAKMRVVCAGCRKIKDKGEQWPDGHILRSISLLIYSLLFRSLRIDTENDCWVDDFSTYQHVCEPTQVYFIFLSNNHT